MSTAPLRFLADESCDFSVVRALRAQAFDVVAVKQFSMSQVRNKLSALVRDLNDRDHIELTRYGQPVAVLFSLRAYRRMSGERPDFWSAYQAFRRPHSLKQLNIAPDVFDDVRDPSPGREVHF